MATIPPGTLGPALAGHAFQQTALVAMLPILVERLGLPAPAIGGAVGCGMLAAAAALPVLGARIGRRQTVAALWGLLTTSMALAALVTAPVAISPTLALALLAAIRLAQGVSAATLLITAQSASLAVPEAPRRALARAQFWGGIGRALSAALVGPMLAVALVLPMAPAALGAAIGLARLPRGDWALRRARIGAPDPRALGIPLAVNAGLGAAQVALGPLLAAQAGIGTDAAAGKAGICLAAANLGFLAAQRWIAPRAGPRTARIAAGVMALAAVAIPFPTTLAAVAVLCALVGGAAGVVVTANLFAVLSRHAETRGSAAGWNVTATMGGLALGVALGSALQPLGRELPFLAAALLILPLTAPLRPPERSTT